MDKKIFSEVKDNIGIVWLNRPEKKNALNDDRYSASLDRIRYKIPQMH